MMTWKIRYTDKARRDLRNIMEYVSYDLLEPETASHPAAFSHTLAGWPLFTPMKNTTTYYNNSSPAALAPGAHLSTASRSPSPFQGRHRFFVTYVITSNALGSPERGAVSAS